MGTPPESLEEAAARLEHVAPGYLDLVRRRSAELGLPKTPEERARRMIALVSNSAAVNADPPTASSRRAAGLAKRGVASLVRFYFLHLTEQVAELGESAALMGDALCDYVAALERELSEMRERVDRLEGQGTGPYAGQK